MKSLLVLLALTLCFLVKDARADFVKGLEAYQIENYEAAFDAWVKAAEGGDVAAMRNVGHLFRWGKGVEKNLARASYWYHRAAKEGFDKAQYNLAMLYLTGEGVVKNEQEAVRWLELASKQGHSEAKLKLEELKGETSGSLETSEKDIVLTESFVEKKIEQPNPMVETKVEPEAELIEETPQIFEEEIEEKMLVHIGSYNNERTAVLGWQQMMKKYVGFERFDMTIKKVNIKDKGEMFRLFAKGDKTDAIDLCQKIKTKKEYCVVYDENNKIIF